MSRRILALLTLLSVAAVYLWAHEGHQALPTKGIVGPDGKGRIALSPEARAALGAQRQLRGFGTMRCLARAQTHLGYFSFRYAHKGNLLRYFSFN